MPGLYDDPAAYELAYSFRDVAAECDFLCGVTLRRLGRPPRSAVELASGPAVHARELARRGVKVYAVDTSVGAAEYLRRVAPEVSPVTADMRRFTLPEPVDLAYCPLGSFAFLLDEAAWAEGLNAAADALVPGGVLVLELVPGDAERAAPAHWTVSDGGATVHVTAGPTQADEETYAWELRLVLERDGQRTEQAEHHRQRRVTAAQIESSLRGSDRFGQVDLYADYDVRRRWHHDPTVVAVARRR